MSRADPGPLPPAPTLRGALRAAALDVYYHSLRVVPVNVTFAAGLVVALVAWAIAGPLVAAGISALLSVPLAGLARLGALAARGEDVNLSDALDPIRRRPLAVIGGGAALLVAAIVLATNVETGILAATPFGIVLATLAFWGLIATLALGFAFWPLLVDPWRADRPSMAAARVAALLVVAHPIRLGVLAVVLTLTLVVSTILFAALLTVGVGFVLIVACRYVLPAADRLESGLAASGRPLAHRAPSGRPAADA